MFNAWCRFNKCIKLNVLHRPSICCAMASSQISRKASTQNAPSSCKVVLAGSIAKSLLTEVREGIVRLDRPLRLHGFLANRDPAAKMYAEWTAKTCRDKYRLPVQSRDSATFTNAGSVASTSRSAKSMEKLWKTRSETRIRMPT